MKEIQKLTLKALIFLIALNFTYSSALIFAQNSKVETQNLPAAPILSLNNKSLSVSADAGKLSLATIGQITIEQKNSIFSNCSPYQLFSTSSVSVPQLQNSAPVMQGVVVAQNTYALNPNLNSNCAAISLNTSTGSQNKLDVVKLAENRIISEPIRPPMLDAYVFYSDKSNQSENFVVSQVYFAKELLVRSASSNGSISEGFAQYQSPITIKNNLTMLQVWRC